MKQYNLHFKIQSSLQYSVGYIHKENAEKKYQHIRNETTVAIKLHC